MATNASSGKNHQVCNTENENFILIWLDAGVNISEENLNAQKELRTIITNFKAFENIDTCHKYITSLSEENQVILIVSGRFGEELVHQIHKLAHVLAIYVFCMDHAKNSGWAKKFKKVKQFSRVSYHFFLYLD
jgi:hypothetical protein